MAGRSSRPARADRADFGTLLRAHRTRLPLTQEELAERAGLSERTLRNLEGGRIRRPYPDTVRRLADALNLTGEERQDFEAAARQVTVGSSNTSAGPPSDLPGPVPYQLPPDVADFTGRSEQIAVVRELLYGTAADRPATVVVSAVAGKAGVGKTALAVHVAHQLRDAFPDGQLYVNLHGAEPHPLEAAVVLARFLRALGLDGAIIPADQAEREALYRACLASRRVLVVLDDAASEAQVRPLLPGTPGCAVLVTSRARLVGLEGARLLDLEVLQTGQAIELLARIVGTERVAAEPAAAAAIVGYCGRLPLAVRVAGARLAARPHWPLARLAGRLADERRRLDELTLGDLEIRASLALSYDGLQDEQRRAFRLLGLLEVPGFAAWVAAALLNVPPARGEELVEALVDAQLLEVAGADPAGQVRYRFHDLVRLVARERSLAEDPGAERRRALERALGGWLALAEQADGSLPIASLGLGGGTALGWRVDEPTAKRLLADPLAWFETERAALLAAIGQASAAGLDTLVWRLAGALENVFILRNDFDGWRRTSALGLAAARRSQSRWGEGRMLRGLGELHLFLDRGEEAIDYHHQAIRAFRDAGDRRGATYPLPSLADLYRAQGRFADAVTCAEQALQSFRDCGDRGGEAYALYELGSIRAEQGGLEEAVVLLEDALRFFRDLKDRAGAGFVLRRLGHAQLRRGDLGQARVRLDEALRLFEALGGRLDVAYVLQHLGELHLHLGNRREARSLAERALATCVQFGDRCGQAMALHTLGRVASAEGALERAEADLGQSLQVLQATRLPLPEARVLSSLGGVQAAAGRPQAARTSWRRALELFRQLGAAEATPLEAHLSVSNADGASSPPPQTETARER